MGRKRKRRYRYKKRFWLLLLILALAFVLGVFLLLRSCGEQEPATKPGTSVTGSGLLEAREDAGDAYLGQILFIGDSRTIGFSQYHLLPGKQVLAETSLNHADARDKRILYEGDKRRIPDVAGKVKPRVAIVAFGINGMGVFSENKFMSEYKGLMQDIRSKSPETILVVQSILPVSEGVGYEQPEMNNQVIDGYNVKLIQMARDEGYYYLSASEALKDTSGMLSPRFDAGDGIHLNVEAYEAILKYVREHPVPEALAGAAPPAPDESADSPDTSDENSVSVSSEPESDEEDSSGDSSSGDSSGGDSSGG